MKKSAEKHVDFGDIEFGSLVRCGLGIGRLHPKSSMEQAIVEFDDGVLCEVPCGDVRLVDSVAKCPELTQKLGNNYWVCAANGPILPGTEVTKVLMPAPKDFMWVNDGEVTRLIHVAWLTSYSSGTALPKVRTIHPHTIGGTVYIRAPEVLNLFPSSYAIRGTLLEFCQVGAHVFARVSTEVGLELDVLLSDLE